MRPLSTDSGRSATMSEPGRASASRRLISSHCGLVPGRVRLRTGAELALDAYADSPSTGAFILVDETTNDTVGAGMVHAPA